MSKLDWRSHADYEAIKTMEPEALAWEFLRRNPNYRNAFSAALIDNGQHDIAAAQRWGLRFPR